MKLRFDQIFTTNRDGTLSPKMDIRFNGDYRRAGTSIFPGANLGRVDISKHVGHDVEIEQEEDAAIIMGFYPTASGGRFKGT